MDLFLQIGGDIQRYWNGHIETPTLPSPQAVKVTSPTIKYIVPWYRTSTHQPPRFITTTPIPDTTTPIPDTTLPPTTTTQVLTTTTTEVPTTTSTEIPQRLAVDKKSTDAIDLSNLSALPNGFGIVNVEKVTKSADGKTAL